MTPEILLRDAESDGLTLKPTDHGTLRIDGPKDAIARWTPILRARKAELLAVLQPPATGPVPWQQWQAEHPPAPDAPPLTEAEETQIRGWLHFIGETDPGEVADAVLTCWRYPGTRAWILAQHAAIPVRQAVARELAQESVEERAGILEHDGGLARQDAERIAQLAKAFYDHLFGPGVATGCCHGSTGKYCAEGKRLQTIYCKVTKAAHKLT